jgi:hypothetical protein
MSAEFSPVRRDAQSLARPAPARSGGVGRRCVQCGIPWMDHLRRTMPELPWLGRPLGADLDPARLRPGCIPRGLGTPRPGTGMWRTRRNETPPARWTLPRRCGCPGLSLPTRLVVMAGRSLVGHSRAPSSERRRLPGVGPTPVPGYSRVRTASARKPAGCGADQVAGAIRGKNRSAT